MQKRSRLIA